MIANCRECNHSKGSENWLVWYQQQEFYSLVVKELIEEWVENKRYDTEELDDIRINDRTTVCLEPCPV